MTDGLGFLDHPGEMAARIREADWAAHPLGPPDGWPPSLRIALDIALSSSFPTAIYWGPDLRVLYNDAWSTIPGERHPWALGRTAVEVWPDIWEVVGPQFADVLKGKAFASYDEMLPMNRGGIVRETYWNYSLSPIRDEDGRILGVFNQGNETTRAVLAERVSVAETERLRELFQQAPGAVALLRGPRFVVEIANDAMRRLVGDRIVVGRELGEIAPEMAAQGYLARLDEVYRTGEAFRASAAPVFLARHDGTPAEPLLLDFVFQPIRDASGAITDIFVQATDVTARAAAQEALRVSEERLQLALDSSIGIGTWDWDVVANRVTADARFARLYGVDPDVASGGAPITTFFGAIHPDDLSRVQTAIEAALAGAPFSEEYRLVQRDGTVRWVTAQGRARFDDDGRAVRFPGITFDITKRREAENAAREAATDLQLATEAQAFVFRLADRLRGLDSSTQIKRLAATALGRRIGVDRAGFYRVAADGTIRFGASWTSERLSAFEGTMTPEDLGLANVARYRAGDTIVIEDYAADTAVHGTQIGQMSGAGIGVPLRRHGVWAATFYVNSAKPRRWTPDEVSLVETIAEVVWDAVERADAVAALRESEEKFRAIANSIDQMVWSTLPDGFHDYYNERWYEFTGVPHGSTDGEGWANVFHAEDQPRAWAAWRHSLETGEPYRIEYRLRHRSSEYRWVLGSAQPVRDEGGRITRWFGTCTDIEELVRAREVLARSRVDLEAAIVERTEQLMAAEEQLRQAQKMEAVGQLTGGIAHDFNNMLAVVIGALDLLGRRLAQGNTDVARYVDAARDGAERAAALTQRLLAFSRQQPLAPAPIDLNAMVEGMADLLGRTIGESIVIETRLAPGLWPATADPSQLENAILNLAVNARDAMPRGGHLTIRTANENVDAQRAGGFGIAQGDYVSVSVGDTGAGMSAEIAAKAFDPFFTTKSVGKGTGLGLSQVFGFVRQSGGHVALDTAPGRGTIVRILLPRDTSNRAPMPSARRLHDELARGRGGEIVMVVEDDARVRSFSVEALRELGYTVVHAADGPSALDMIDRGQAIHLLFTDVVMPEMTGRELAAAVAERMPGVRVLYTSGYTRESIETEAGHGESVLAKPFEVSALAQRVRAKLDAPA